MKIIFDNEEEKDAFFINVCPSSIGLNENCGHDESTCMNCWRQSGLKYEIATDRQTNPTRGDTILEARCQRYREFITSTDDWYERAVFRYNAGKLTPNDLNYLMRKEK